MASVLREFEHLRIHLEELKKATNSFSSKVIGKGGFGEVYEGIVSHHKGRSIVAIKRLNRELGQGDAEFWKEIMMLSRYTHKNLISLLGFCDEDGEKIIVYEHASNRSLDHHLSSTALTWTQRLKICLDVARGLAHLHDHNGTQQRVLHRDIKSANILLDDNWNAKLSDMGLSKLGPANQRHTVLFTNAVGTPGYCDPQYTMTYALTKESDIYSLGVVLFEVLCGTLCVKCTNGQLEVLVPMWKQSYKHKKLDQIIFKDLIPTMDPTSLKTFSKVAFQCLDNSREQRPTISRIVEKLEIALKLKEGREMKQDNAVGTSQTYLNVILSKGKGLFLGKKGQQWISPSSYNNMTGGRTGLMLTDETSESRGNNDDYFQSQSVNGGEDSYEEDGPGVENFQIIGDANPGGKLLGCGFPVRGTSLCMFQWTRHLQDGSREYIEGATNPNYVVTADDVNKLIAVECIPMDDQGRQGRIVRRFANEQNKISCDSKMQQKINGYMSARQASFSVFLQMDPSEKWEQATFILRRFDYQIRIHRTQSIFIEEKYSGETVIKIPSGSTTQFVLTHPDGSSNYFTFDDNCTRDTCVLTMRMLQSKALDERGKAKA